LHYVSSEEGVNLEWDKYEIEGNQISFDSYSVFRGSDSTALSPIEETIPQQISVFTDKDPNALQRRYYYRVAGMLTNPCYPQVGGKKTDSDPVSQSLSNIEDNRHPDTVSTILDPVAGSVNIYPNPFNQTTILQFTNPEKHSYTLYVTDISGQVCRIIKDIATSEFILKKGDLKPGIYFIELRGLDIYRGKLIVE
jgi:hypothetical protein